MSEPDDQKRRLGSLWTPGTHLDFAGCELGVAGDETGVRGVGFGRHLALECCGVAFCVGGREKDGGGWSTRWRGGRGELRIEKRCVLRSASLDFAACRRTSPFRSDTASPTRLLRTVRSADACKHLVCEPTRLDAGYTRVRAIEEDVDDERVRPRFERYRLARQSDRSLLEVRSEAEARSGTG